MGRWGAGERGSGGAAGLFHSRKNRDFVGVVPPCLPPLTNHQMRVSDLWAGTGAPPLPRMKQPCPAPPLPLKEYRKGRYQED